MLSVGSIRSALAKVVVAVLAMVSLVAIPATAAANPTIPGSTSGDGLIWLPNYGWGSVDAFDPVTLDRVVSIPGVGSHSMVIKSTPDHSKLFVGNFADLVITVIDTKTRSIIKKIPVLGPPWATIQMSTDGKFLFVPTALTVVNVIDTTTMEIVRTVPTLIPPVPSHIEISPDAKIMYAFSGLGFVTKYDTTTGLPLGIPLFIAGFAPGWGALSADGNKIYTINFVSGLTIIDVPSWTVQNITFTSPLDGPLSGTLTPDGNELWMCNYIGKRLVILDAHTGLIKREVSLPEGPVYVGFSSDGKTAYMSLFNDDSGLFGLYDGPKPPGYTEYALANAFSAAPLLMDTTLASYDVKTVTRIRSNVVKGVLIAGVYPE